LHPNAEGTWYYYSAYAFTKVNGWSLVDFKGLDAVQVGVANQNWVRGAAIESNMQGAGWVA
jgi:hypothetical protein